MDVSSWNMTVIWCTHVKKICKIIKTLENLPWRDMKWMLQQRGGWMMQLNSNMINGDLRWQINRWKRGEYGGAMMTSAERSDGVKMMGGRVWKEHSWCSLLVGAHYVRVFWTSTNFLFLNNFSFMQYYGTFCCDIFFFVVTCKDHLLIFLSKPVTKRYQIKKKKKKPHANILNSVKFKFMTSKIHAKLQNKIRSRDEHFAPWNENSKLKNNFIHLQEDTQVGQRK